MRCAVGMGSPQARAISVVVHSGRWTVNIANTLNVRCSTCRGPAPPAGDDPSILLRLASRLGAIAAIPPGGFPPNAAAC